jgi:cell division protein FtsB
MRGHGSSRGRGRVNVVSLRKVQEDIKALQNEVGEVKKDSSAMKESITALKPKGAING